MFVTWKTTKDHVLRGCIGTTSPINLIIGLKRYSLRSALEDGRFSPIKVSELESLTCSISLLTDFSNCSNYCDWTIGMHGISIKFEDGGHHYSALYLPEVMTECGTMEHYKHIALTRIGFNYEEALYSLIKKSGHKGAVNRSFLQKLQITRFQSRKASVAVTEYIRIRNDSH